MIELFASPDFPRTAALMAVSCWLTIAVGNNRRDRPTNWTLLGVMMKQDLLKDEPVLGQGLKHRRITNPEFPKKALSVIIAVQMLTTAFLWIAAVVSGLNWLGLVQDDIAIATINVAVATFFALWTVFLCGGLWFGYWIKSWHVQQVHFTLFIIALLLWQLAG